METVTVRIGADWDSEKCVVVILEEGKRPRRATVKRDPTSVASLMAKFAGQEVLVGIEAGDDFWRQLWESGGAKVFVFDGKKSHRFSESLRSSGACDDKHSASDLLAMLQSTAHRAACNVVQSPRARAFRRLLECHERASIEVTRCSNQLRAELRQFRPEIIAFLGKLSSAWLLRLIMTAPTARAWSELTPEQQQGLLNGSSKAKRPALLEALAQNWGAIAPEMESSMRACLYHTAHALQQARERLKALKDEIAKHVDADPVASMVKQCNGMGPLLSAAITIAVEQNGPQDRDAAAKRLGLAPVTRRSGTLGDTAPLVMMRRSRSSLMGKFGHFIAIQVIAHCQWAKAAHAYNRAHGKSCFHSYRCIARSFLRVLTAMLRDNTSFDEQRYVAALKSNGVPWAMAL